MIGNHVKPCGTTQNNAKEAIYLFFISLIEKR